jgi:hypothetical protein
MADVNSTQTTSTTAAPGPGEEALFEEMFSDFQAFLAGPEAVEIASSQASMKEAISWLQEKGSAHSDS